MAPKKSGGKGMAHKNRSVPANKGGSKVRGGYQNKSHPKGTTERRSRGKKSK